MLPPSVPSFSVDVKLSFSGKTTLISLERERGWFFNVRIFFMVKFTTQLEMSQQFWARLQSVIRALTFRIFEFRIHVYSSVADPSIQPVHNHGQLYRPEWAWHSTHKDCLPWIQRVGTVHHKIRVIQVPWSDLNLHVTLEKEMLAFQFSVLLFKNALHR